MDETLAKKLVDGLRGAGVDFVTYLPETRLSQILPLMQQDPAFQLVPVGSEAEGVSIAAGAALGGKTAASYMEGTGVYVSSYNLLTVGIRYGVPFLLLVGYVGSIEDKRNSYVYVQRGTHLIPQLDALGIEYIVLKDGTKLDSEIKDAVRMMHALKKPVALLFTGEFTL
jgi:sulfopyruvate decarboxylase TPP-binding subunit